MNKKVIMLDPGHGGRDPGALHKELKINEKDLVLDFCNILQKTFEKQECTAILTRNSDKEVKLIERCRLENKEKPDCFVSIHMDAGTTEKATGATAWLHTKATKDIINWGEDIISGIEKAGMTSNRSRKINFGLASNPSQELAVNRDTNSPSLLIELGFVTSRTNINEYNKNACAYAEAICKATLKFLDSNYSEPTQATVRCI